MNEVAWWWGWDPGENTRRKIVALRERNCDAAERALDSRLYWRLDDMGDSPLPRLAAEAIKVFGRGGVGDE